MSASSSSFGDLRVVALTDGNSAVLQIKGFVCETWAQDQPLPPPKLRQDHDVLVTRLPFAIGRVAVADAADENDKLEPRWRVPAGDGAHCLVVANSKVSKRHATIYLHGETGRLRLRVHGRNGVDYEGTHFEQDNEVEISSRAAVRIGPFYAQFLLPRDKPPPPSAGGTGAGAAGGAGLQARPRAARPQVPYGRVVGDIYLRHFAPMGGYFTALDIAKIAPREFPGQGLPDDLKLLRAGIKRFLDKPGCGYEVVDASEVPAAVLSALQKTHEQQGSRVFWYRKARASTGGAEGGGDGGDAAADEDE